MPKNTKTCAQKNCFYLTSVDGAIESTGGGSCQNQNIELKFSSKHELTGGVARAALSSAPPPDRLEHRQATAIVYLRAIVLCKVSAASCPCRPMHKIAVLAVLPSARAACSVVIAARGMKTLSCPFGSGTSGDTASSLVMQCNRLSPMSDGSVLASYGATSGAVPARPRMPAPPRLNKNECKAVIAVLATAAVAEDFGWGGRWSSPTVSYRERAFAYVKPCTLTETP
jgi:hypothetical protein